MEDRYANRFEMAKVTLRTLDDHADAWSAVPDTADDRDRLAALVARIRDAAQRQSEPTEAATTLKAELREAVEDAVPVVAGAVRSWALRRGHTDLARRVKVTKSELGDLRASALAERSETVVAAAREHADGDDGVLARTALTAAQLDALDALDDRLADALDTPRAAIIAKSEATAAIATAASAVSELLSDHLDPAVEALADAHPAFAEAYRRARVVVDRGRGPSTPDDGGPDGDAA